MRRDSQRDKLKRERSRKSFDQVQSEMKKKSLKPESIKDGVVVNKSMDEETVYIVGM